MAPGSTERGLEETWLHDPHAGKVPISLDVWGFPKVGAYREGPHKTCLVGVPP